MQILTGGNSRRTLPAPRAIVPERWPEAVAVWEASVRATHDFLTEEDLLFYKERMIPAYLPAVTLWGVTEKERLCGFVGVAEKRIEMLFVRPEYMGCGIGRKLVEFAIERFDVRTVDVNEQNPAARGFYERLGFRTNGRSPNDGEGKPYPLLHMELRREPPAENP